MKKALLLTSCLLLALLTHFPSFAEGTDDLKFDEQKVNAELNKLNKLEQHVLTHEGVTLDEVSAANGNLTEGIALEVNSIAAVLADGELPANIPPFWWGFCLGWVGLLVVYLITDNDKPQVKKAFTGCLISTGIAVVFYVLLYGLILGNFGSGI
jgi:hypothetical protein